MLRRVIMAVGASAMACGGLAATASATTGASAPPLPKAANGHKVTIVASGVPTAITSFAFGGGRTFVGVGPEGAGSGGVFVLHKGKAVKLKGSPFFVGGLAYRKGTLYVSAATATGKTTVKAQILAWSGWNGTTFKHRKVLYTAPKTFPGFNGLAFGPDGRLYVGVDVGFVSGNDHGAPKAPYQYDLLAFNVTAKKPSPKIVAQGIRQPWQIAFAGKFGYVTDLGQDKGAAAAKAPDFVLRFKGGEDFGFPKCTWVSKAACKGFAKPFHFFAPHTDVGGIGIIGKTIYISEFGFDPSKKPQVVALSTSGGKAKPFLTGFAAPIIGLGVHAGWVYVGGLDGNIYRVHS